MNYKWNEFKKYCLSLIFSKRIIKQRNFWAFIILFPSITHIMYVYEPNNIINIFKKESYIKKIDLDYYNEYEHITKDQWEIIMAEYVKRFPRN